MWASYHSPSNGPESFGPSTYLILQAGRVRVHLPPPPNIIVNNPVIIVCNYMQQKKFHRHGMYFVKKTCYEILSLKNWGEPKTIMFPRRNAYTINWIKPVMSNSHSFIIADETAGQAMEIKNLIVTAFKCFIIHIHYILSYELLFLVMKIKLRTPVFPKNTSWHKVA